MAKFPTFLTAYIKIERTLSWCLSTIETLIKVYQYLLLIETNKNLSLILLLEVCWYLSSIENDTCLTFNKCDRNLLVSISVIFF